MLVAEAAQLGQRITALCRGLGFAVAVAATPLDALRQYRALRPRVTLLEGAALPQHGLPLLRQVRALDPAARLVLLNVRATPSLVAQAIHAGAVDVLGAPLAEARLVRALCAVIDPPTERQHERVAVRLPARLTLGATPAAPRPGVIEDLGGGGVRCRLQAPLTGHDAHVVGEVAQVTFVLPDGRGLVRAVGRVARQPDAATVALAFVSLSEAHAARIEAYCRALLAAQPDAAQATSADRTAVTS